MDGGELVTPTPRSEQMSTAQVWLRSAAVFIYFVIATVFVPSMVVESSALAGPPSAYVDQLSPATWSLIRDLIGTTVWLVALVIGFVGLRRLQARGHL